MQRNSTRRVLETFAFVFLLISYGLVYALQFVLDLTVLLSIIAAFIGFVVTTGLTLYLYVKGAYKTKKNTGYKQLITMATFLIEMFPEVDLIPVMLLMLLQCSSLRALKIARQPKRRR